MAPASPVEILHSKWNDNLLRISARRKSLALLVLLSLWFQTWGAGFETSAGAAVDLTRRLLDALPLWSNSAAILGLRGWLGGWQ
jgi:hypothetical protein